jgi:hypothetical protein
MCKPGSLRYARSVYYNDRRIFSTVQEAVMYWDNISSPWRFSTAHYGWLADNELGKYLEPSGPSLIRYYFSILLEWLRETAKNLRQDSRCPGLNSNRALPEYKARALSLLGHIWLQYEEIKFMRSVFLTTVLKLQAFGMWCRVVWWTGTNVPEENIFQTTWRHIPEDHNLKCNLCWWN